MLIAVQRKRSKKKGGGGSFQFGLTLTLSDSIFKNLRFFMFTFPIRCKEHSELLFVYSRLISSKLGAGGGTKQKTLIIFAPSPVDMKALKSS